MSQAGVRAQLLVLPENWQSVDEGAALDAFMRETGQPLEAWHDLQPWMRGSWRWEIAGDRTMTSGR